MNANQPTNRSTRQVGSVTSGSPDDPNMGPEPHEDDSPGRELGGEVDRDLDQIRRLGEERLEDLREFGGEVRHRIEERVRAKPLVSIGVAFGAGVVVSSLFSSRLTRLAILAAGGYAAREIFGARLIDILGSPDEEEQEEELLGEREGVGRAARRSSRRRRRVSGEAAGQSESSAPSSGT